jgi:general secretion pathway protein C
MRLVGVIHWPRAPERSFAAITNAAGKALLYRPGMQVDGREVAEITAEEARLRQGAGALCAVRMFAAATGDRPAAPLPPPPAVGVSERAPGPPGLDPASSIPAADLDRGITRVSDSQFNVSRSLLDRVLENQAELMRSARIVPHEEGGRVVGVKLYGIRRQALLGRVGIENGDVLRTINGYDMTSPDTALEAYARLRSVSNLSVQVIRRGQPMTTNYSIQ